MAKSASANVVQSDLRPADFRGAVQLLRSIKAKKDKISGVNGEISKIYSRVEGEKKVNGKAARLFNQLDNMTPEDRQDCMRALNGLIDAAGWAETEADLMDQAEDNVVHMRVGAGAVPDGDPEVEDAVQEVESAAAEGKGGKKASINSMAPAPKPDGDDFEEMSDEELAAQKPRQEDAEKAKATKSEK